MLFLHFSFEDVVVRKRKDNIDDMYESFYNFYQKYME
jgi:hypothetical protein